MDLQGDVMKSPHWRDISPAPALSFTLILAVLTLSVMELSSIVYYTYVFVHTFTIGFQIFIICNTENSTEMSDILAYIIE